MPWQYWNVGVEVVNGSTVASCGFKDFCKDPAVTSSDIDIRVRGIVSDVGEIPETCDDIVRVFPPPLIEDIWKVGCASISFPGDLVFCYPWESAKKPGVEPRILLNVGWS